MRDLEAELISSVLRQGSAQRPISMGVHEGWFSTETLKHAWREIVNHGSKSVTYNQTPSVVRLCKRVPGLQQVLDMQIEIPVNEIISDMIDIQQRATIRAGVADIEETLQTQGIDAAVKQAQQLSRDLRGLAAGNTHSRQDLVDAIPYFINIYEKRVQGGGLVGLPLPWEPLNRATGGLQPSLLYMIYAPAKNCKTWMGLEIGCIHPFQAGNARVLIVSCEMPADQLYRRILARLCKLDYGEVVQGKLPLDARDACFTHLTELHREQLSRMSAEISSSKHRDIRIVKAKSSDGVSMIRDEIEAFEPDVVLVDGMYLLANDRKGGKRDNDWKSMSDITQDLKSLAMEVHLPIIASTQANREGKKTKFSKENKENWTDLGFGIGPAQDADVLIKLQKITETGDGVDRVLITLPALRESKTDAFTVVFRPVWDFSIDMVDITEEMLADIMVESDFAEAERGEYRFSANVNPFK
jgi:hypothetical protein